MLGATGICQGASLPESPFPIYKMGGIASTIPGIAVKVFKEISGGGMVSFYYPSSTLSVLDCKQESLFTHLL